MHPGRLIYAVNHVSDVGDKIFFGVSNALTLFVLFNLIHESRHQREERPNRLITTLFTRDARARARVPELSWNTRYYRKTRALCGGARCFRELPRAALDARACSGRACGSGIRPGVARHARARGVCALARPKRPRRTERARARARARERARGARGARAGGVARAAGVLEGTTAARHARPAVGADVARAAQAGLARGAGGG